MKKLFLLFIFIGSGFITFAQPQRPKLVVGIVVDQMRWDYLYRYSNKYSEGGFKRLLREGYSCGNTLINYLPSYLRWQDVLIVVSLSLILSFLATIYPARRAAQIQPAEALRYE